MSLLTVSDLFGPFHPVLVHLPIGMLLLALLMQWLSSKEKYVGLKPAIPIAYLAGSIGAVLSCITGWLLASGGEYDESILDIHRWMGISVATFSIAGYYFARKPGNRFQLWGAVLLAILIPVTGHLGGTLSYGEGYLTKGFSSISKDSAAVQKVIANAQEAIVFTDIIQPVLQEKCYSCHGEKKQKGGLRLDGSEWIVKGGKDGKVVTAGNPGASELYKRVIMDPLEEKHMPPKGKPQLSEQQRVLLHWWIATGLNFTKKAKELEQPVAIKTVLSALEKTAVSKKPDLPAAPVEQVPEEVLNRLRNAGVTISPVAMNSNYLTANFVNMQLVDNKTDSLLQQVKKQLLWLKMPGAQLSNKVWETIASFTNLAKLSLEHSNITDADLAKFKTLKQIQWLNLVGTKISIKGLEQLKELPLLTSLYLAQTSIQKTDWPLLQKIFPRAKLDSGGYQVSFLATDTQLLKSPPVRK